MVKIRKFTVTGKQSREINKKTPVKNSHAKSNMAIIETVAAIIVVAGLGVWYYKKHRK